MVGDAVVNQPEPIGFTAMGTFFCLSCAKGISERHTKRAILPGEFHGDNECWCFKCGAPIWPKPCVFCEIVVGNVDAEWILMPDTWPDAVAFIPLNPVTEGHCLIVPKVHVRDFAHDPEVFAATARRAAELMRWTDRPMNIITSRGREATQSVFHLHLHLVPRAENDGLALPWYSGKRSGRNKGDRR